jgi:ankyrin repeat protein
VRELLRIKYPLDEPKVNGITAVAIAAQQGNLEILKLLVEGGANIDKTSPAGIGPLYLAIKTKNRYCAEYLVEKGARLYIDDPIKVDYSPIFLAVRMKDIGILEVMCDTNTDIDTVFDSLGYNPLTLAVKLDLHEVVSYLSL